MRPPAARKVRSLIRQHQCDVARMERLRDCIVDLLAELSAGPDLSVSAKRAVSETRDALGAMERDEIL